MTHGIRFEHRTVRRRHWLWAGLVPIALLLGACQQASGGGHLAPASGSTDPALQATFGFLFRTQPDSPDGNGTLAGTYRDPGAHVHLRGTGAARPVAPPSGSPAIGCFSGTAAYQALDGVTSGVPGEASGGTLALLVCDYGPGPSSWIDLTILDGPYAGYRNTGVAQGSITLK